MADPPKALTRQERDLAVVRRADDRLRRRVAHTVADYMSAGEIDDAGAPVDPGTEREPDGRPKGWTHRRYRVARDGRLPIKEQPGYLASAIRIHDSYARRDADKPPAPTLNVNLQFNVTNPAAQEVVGPRYRVIDVTEDEKERGS